MSKAIKTPMELAHAYGFALQPLIELVAEQEQSPDETINAVDIAMLRRRLEGANMSVIAKEFNVSSTRVRQRTLRGLVRLRWLRQKRRNEQVAHDAVASLAGTSTYDCEEVHFR